MVVLLGVRNAEVQTDFIQKIGLWQHHTTGFEIACHIKHQTVSAYLEAAVVIQQTTWIATVLVQDKFFDQSSVLTLNGV